MRKTLTILNLLICLWGVGQMKPDLGFIKHLSDKNLHKEVIYLVNQTNLESLGLPARDSLLYYRGWSYYSEKDLLLSATDLNCVSAKSIYYEKSQYFAAYNYMHLKKHVLAKEVFDEIHSGTVKNNDLYNFELSGFFLLQRDYDSFKNHIELADTSFYAISKESSNLYNYAHILENHKRKSPLLGGILSAIVPGSGKFYAGKIGQGISSLLSVAGLGLVTWENYNKDGIKDFKTIFFGSLCAAFYIGNIYGTVFTIKIAENEFQDEFDHKILFDLHVPLRVIFN